MLHGLWLGNVLSSYVKPRQCGELIYCASNESIMS